MNNNFTENTYTDNTDFKDIRLNLIFVGSGLLLALLKSLFVPSHFIGFANILLYIILLFPLIYLSIRKQNINPYTKFFIPILLILITDIFLYDNTLTQSYLPSIVVILTIILYLTHMHSVEAIYQTLLPKLAISFSPFTYLKTFSIHLFALKTERSILKRVFIGLAITIPFLALFLTLFMHADHQFNVLVSNIINFFPLPKFDAFFTLPIYFILFLFLFIYGHLNIANRPILDKEQPFDMIIIGIFLGMLNLLFISFLIFQVAYLFGGEEYIRESGITPSQFAREGFFQLAWVISIVVVIFLGIMRRFQGEISIKVFMSLLMLQTIIMGVASLKKMHLYQALLGATTLRYYVEWFEYFLIAVLSIGIILMLLKQRYKNILDTVVVLGIVAFTFVASQNVDYMIASNNINKFKYNPQALDTRMISHLSLDALPAVVGTDIKIIPKRSRLSCNDIMQYHFGVCQIFKTYNDNNIQDFYMRKPTKVLKVINTVTSEDTEDANQ